MVMLTCVILLLNILGIAFRFNFDLQNICMVLKSNLHEYNFNAFLLQSNWNEFAYFQIKKKKKQHRYNIISLGTIFLWLFYKTSFWNKMIS